MKYEVIFGNVEQVQLVIFDLGKDILNIMEQGIFVWSDVGICEFYNLWIFDLLELLFDDFVVGLNFDVFCWIVLECGDIDEDDFYNSELWIKLYQFYFYD